MKLTLSWPPRELSPNARRKHLHVRDVRNKFKHSWWWLAKHARVTVTDETRLVITFHPPDNRRRDLDNMLASIKYGLDGLAKAAGVDDHKWNAIDLRRGEKAEGGAVIVEIRNVSGPGGC